MILRKDKLERAKGIEPSYRAWEALVLPLNYARSWFFRLYAHLIEQQSPSYLSDYLIIMKNINH